MTFAPGSRLGSNEIIAKVGEGGMGEVYRATDVRLKRHVAIKVLPAAFTADKDRLVRFEREMRDDRSSPSTSSITSARVWISVPSL